MMKQVIAIFLLIAFANQTFSQALIVLDYYANTGSFIKKCENKARPMMHCNGKCQMMKKMKEAGQKSDGPPERKPVAKNEAGSSRSFFGTVILRKENAASVFGSYISKPCPLGSRTCVFHPPALV